MNKTLPYITSIAIFVIASFVLEPWLADTRRGKSHSIRVLAATTVATPSATPSATPTVITITPSQTQDIQEKIKTLVKENLSATESTLKEKINQRTLVGFVGLIQSINSGNITINTKDGTILQITTDEKSVYNKAGTGIKISSLAISDKIIVIGTLLKEDIVLAKRIVVVPDEPIQIVSGTIVSKVSSVDIKKKLIGLTVNNQEVLFGLTKKSTIKIEEIKAGMTIFAITKKYDGKDLLSRAKIL
ncbi:hypothetical protein A3K29_04580 [Candidatus Collierbacteria bacterium RIFOXYB2_FULL_46_14]|uniref:DUF5666 domain-containing protein n=1 Tax=Candidatus Collierbacteria bacterium GW2011_GWA2_46_26 TaxID=1618381 RepID=A0A0G1PK96_9BACT|nr:MAG: hypothetical protein UW29_C0005G0020 [Candidatus Collierbacteria bacterium GW2011_GWC2_44_13]KKU33146.1 MAG: hypothetical protein UX47_C0006G0117 [Candidatus Collierbacteria bacterium GW2011_GWA2_46_26]OGD73374.1 MAG: hypothetical protein A3K29_04580 [Candidatus Collierbacteria bacterium RIFOXYB2_FULL_46_14]OGD76416.1 MAG: hypothetical protein A3K43_04580 [Candidatus Collierbacteria bacterium RIFOXYA2_FULL_46_20]OGD77752.1 MAG: hypothetical protein A3K39_04580 [Candidatus Collierbacteri